MANWIMRQTTADIPLMSKTLKVSETMAYVMAHRGIRSKNQAIKYLNPGLNFLSSEKMKDMDVAADLILDAISNRKRIAIYGDYDADGVCSTVILYKALKLCGAIVSYYIPHREEEGYGLTKGSVDMLKQAEADVILCCDNGISALEEILHAKALGLAVVVLDHHEPGFIERDGVREDILPLADAIVDPKQKSCGFPFKMLCAGGIALKFAAHLFEKAGLDFSVHRDEFLVFAMIATFCDIVDLLDENRIIAKNGLDVLNANKKVNLGLWCLLKQKDYHLKDLNEHSIGFIIGPCINASGRLKTASLAVRLFLCEDEDEATELAEYLSELNDERKEITAEAFESAMNDLSNSTDKVIVLFNPEIHESIAGIVAGRIKERFYRPAIVLTRSGDFVKGSGRSIECYNLFDELFKVKELFIKFGGHTMAAGLSIKEDNVEELRRRLNENCSLSDDDFQEIIRIDKEVPLEDVTYSLAKELRFLAPFGKENKEPLFGVKNVVPDEIRFLEEKRTIILSFVVGDTYRKLKAICFGLNDLFRERISEVYGERETEKILKGVLRGSGLSMDLVYSIEVDSYNGNQSVQLRIRDFRVFQAKGEVF